MTRQADTRFANAVAVHPEPERFQDAAFAELQIAPPWSIGICFNPSCGKPFSAARRWQIYCGTACQAAGTAEMRKWGHKMALPLLVHRLGKYDRRDAGVMDRTRAARRYVTQVQSAWLADRNIRQREAAQ